MSLLRGKRISQNRLFTEVTLKTGGYGGEKVRGGDGSGGITGSGEQDQPPRLHEAPRDEDLVSSSLSSRSFVEQMES